MKDEKKTVTMECTREAGGNGRKQGKAGEEDVGVGHGAAACRALREINED